MGAHPHPAPGDVPCHCPKHMDPHTSPPSHGQGLPALLSRNVTTSWPALSLRRSCHLDPVSWCLVEQERFLFQKEIQTPQKEVLPPPAGFSAPGLAEQGSWPFPSLPAAADTRLGGFQLLCAHVLQVFVLAKCKASRTLQLINMCQGSL